MKSRAAIALATSLLAACSGGHSSSGGDAPPVPAPCAPELPTSLTVSEGGLLTVTIPEGTTYEATGGAVATADGSKVSIRAPYVAAAKGDVALTLSCGRTLAIELRPLAWTRLASWTESTGAKAREYGASWIDPVGTGALVVFGGFHYVPKQFTPANDAWRFDFATSTWTALAGDGLPTLPGGRAAAIPGERAVLFFGGTVTAADGSLDSPQSLYRLDFDEARVQPTKKTNLGSAPGSYTGSFVYDSKRARFLSVCGLDAKTGFNCDVDAYTEAKGFEHLTPTGTPPTGRDGFHYAYDEASDRVILFGGQVGMDNLDLDGETWALDLSVDPPAWHRLFANGAGPEKRRNGAFALDPLGHRLFVWGGTPDGANSVPGLQVLSLERGSEAWTSVDVPADVKARTSGIGVQDAARQRILFGFGNAPAPLRDLWSLDVANVSPR